MHRAGEFIGVVVLNYGSAHLIADNLAGLARAPEHRVIVVDNYSGEDERRRVEELCRDQGWTPVLLDTNTGFAGGINAGLVTARELGADAYLLINPDAEIDAATVAALHQHVREHPLELVAPRIVRPDGSTWAVGSTVDLRTGRMRRSPGLRDVEAYESGWLSGACLALSRELLERTRGLACGYFLYWEDVDFSRRVLQAGGTLAVREDLVVVHSEGGTQRSGDGERRLSDRYYYFNSRNRLVYAARWLDREGLLRWIRHTPRESWQILLRGGRRQLLRTPRPLLAALRGSLAGLGVAVGALAGRRGRIGGGGQLGGAGRIGEDDPLTAAERLLGDSRRDDSPITALMSFPATPPKFNPYRLLLEQGLRTAPGLTIRYFSWRTALLGDYDVFHVHWPEILLEGSTPLKTAARRMLYVLFLLRLRARRIPIVRTLHNLELPKDIDPIEVALLRATERQTSLWIRLNTSTELPADRPGATILHGHYRDWYGRHPQADTVPGRVIFYGLVRRYKGVPELVRAFTASTDDGLSLHVLGKPSTEELAAEIRAAAGDDPRVTLRLGFVEDPDLVAEVSAAELVVLPYQEMHNSAAVLTALSLDRPLLVPDNEVNRKLAAEVGPGWIHTYTGAISAAAIEGALAELRSDPPVGRPDLEQRDWDLGGVQHADAYRVARRYARRAS